MSKRQFIMLLAVLIIIIQFLGFPPSWNKFFTFVCGALIIGIAYRMAPKVKEVNEQTLTYVDYKRDKKDEIVTIVEENITKDDPAQTQ
ncbi:MAG: hypothetical protein WCG02_02465 [Candidatus Taylorbacteria bacterium]